MSGVRTKSSAAGDTKSRVRKHREALRANGLKPVTRWVLDVTNPEVEAEIRRQCLALNGDPAEKEALDFIEHAMDYSGWV